METKIQGKICSVLFFNQWRNIYPCLNPKEAEKKNVFSSIMNKKNRDKNRLFDTVYKQLQGLTIGSTNSGGVTSTNSNNTTSKDG